MSSRLVRNRQVLSRANSAHQLGERTIRGSLFAMVVQPLRIAMVFLSSIVLARLLTPEDFGLVAMAMTVVALLELVCDAGVGAAVVQRRSIDQAEASGLFYFAVGTGVLCLLLGIGLAPVASWVFADPSVAVIVIALSLGLPLSAAGKVPSALLMRSMDWSSLQIAWFAGHLASVLVSMTLAYAGGFGAWAIVIGNLCAGVVTQHLVWVFCGWTPSRGGRWPTDSLVYGGHVIGNGVVEYISNQVDRVMLGARFGAHQLGLYTRAFHLVLLPLNALDNIIATAVVPALSHLQEQPDRWRRVYLDSLTIYAVLGCGGAACMVAAGPAMVTLMYGENWSDAGRIFQILAAASFANVTLGTTSWIFMSLGRSREMLRWTVMWTPVMILALFIAWPFGPVGMAAAHAATATLALVPGVIYATRGAPVRAVEILSIGFPLGLSGAAAAIIGLALPIESRGLVEEGALRLAAAGLAYVAMSAAVIRLLPVFASFRQQLTTRAKFVLPWKTESGQPEVVAAPQ